jgi:CRISPR-associated exonuclease Cas4
MFLILISKILRIKADDVKRTHKIQDGTITYMDLDAPAKPFFSKKYRISGKPDYIVKKEKRYLPVELKTGSYDAPQKNHIFQLAAYCQLIEDNYGIFVPYGVLVYSDGYQFNIPFDPRIRFELEGTINDMRQVIKTGKIKTNMKDSFKCKNCSMREYCSTKIM